MRKEFEDFVQKEGCVEISDGVWLMTSKEFAEEQKGWADDDEAKEWDATAHPYWWNDNEGHDGFYESLDEAMRGLDRLAVLYSRDADGNPLYNYYDKEGLHRKFGEKIEQGRYDFCIDTAFASAEQGSSINEVEGIFNFFVAMVKIGLYGKEK